MKENKMNNYKLTIQYDGARFKGWQRLGNNDNTIQGKSKVSFPKWSEKKLKLSVVVERTLVYML